MKNIVLISSYPKSGNTWLRAFLSNIFNNEKTSFEMDDLASIPICSSRSFLESYSDYELSSLTEVEILNLRSKIYEYISDNSERTVFLKTHDFYSFLPSGKFLFPKNAIKAVIYLIRNPLDVVVSYANHSNSSIDHLISCMNNEKFYLSEGGIKISNQVKQYLSSWSKHVESWTNVQSLNLKVVRYEDMKNDTHNVFKEILNFLEINYEKKHFLSAINNTKFENLKQIENNSGFNEKALGVENFFWKGEVGTWRKYLTDEQIETITNCHQNLMTKYNYLPFN